MSTSSFNAVYAMGAIAETLLGASGRATCVIDGDQSIMSSCIAHILENVDIEHPVGHVINSALQSHHDNYHSCTKSLLVMTSMWLREMDCLVQQGVPLSDVLSGFHQAIDRCVQQLHCTRIEVGNDLISLKLRQCSCTGDLNSGSIPDDRSCITWHSDNSGSMLDDRSHDRKQQQETSDTARKKFQPAILPQDDGDIGDNDDVSWYFEDSNLNSSNDDALEMMINAMGDMQEKLGCFVDVDATSCLDRSHVISHDQSGDMLPSLTNGMTSLSQRDKGMQQDIMPSQVVNTECQENLAVYPKEPVKSDKNLAVYPKEPVKSDKNLAVYPKEPVKSDKNLAVYPKEPVKSDKNLAVYPKEPVKSDKNLAVYPKEPVKSDKNLAVYPKEPVKSDKETKLASIMHELSKTSQLLVKCTHAMSSPVDVSVSNVTHSECNRGSIDDNVGSNIGSNTRSDTVSRAQKSVSNQTSHNSGTNVSAHLEDSDDEFSSCFDDFENRQDNNISNKPLGGTVVPPSGQLSASAGLSLEGSREDTCTLSGKSTAVNGAWVLNGSRHFRTFQSIHPVASTQESSVGEMVRLKSSRHRNDATLEVKTSQVTSPSGELGVTTSECHTNQTTQSGSSRSHVNLEDTTSQDTPSKSHLENVANTRTTVIQNDLSHKVSRFIRCLRQGCEDVLDALTETMLRQLKADNFKEQDDNLRFEVSRVHTVTSVGPIRCDVFDGLVVETDMEQLGLLSGGGCLGRVLLVNGDVSLGFRHKGFTERTKTRAVSKILKSDSRNDSWLDDISDVLSELNVGGVLVHGSINEEFREMCYARRIVVFDRVPYKVVQGVAESCLREPAVYVSEATQDNVADDVIIRPWSCDWMDHLLTSVSYALVQPSLSLVQTVMISHPCGNVGRMKEETFWHCAHRLHNMLVDGAVLPGGGATEEACVAVLQSNKSSKCVQDEHMFSSLVNQHVAMGLENFAQLVRRNSSFSATDQSDVAAGEMEGATVYDCLKAKLEAWRTAEYLVGVVMGADMEVVTGVDKNYVRAQRGGVLGHV